MKPTRILATAMALGMFTLHPGAIMADEAAVPGIYIERINDRSAALLPGLKSQYKLCADSRQLYKQLFVQGGVGWEAVKESLPKGSDIRAATMPEPDWEREGVGKQLEREYFFGDHYALY